jgi:general secretion pathway protein D
VKTNLLIFLTPYIIRDSSDFRRIFERKMRERQQFVEQFYGAATGYDVAIDFNRKAGPVGRMSQLLIREVNKAENGGSGSPGEKIYAPAAGGAGAGATGPNGPPTGGAPGQPGSAPPPGSVAPQSEPPVQEPPAPPSGETPPVPSPERLQPQPPAPGELR